MNRNKKVFAGLLMVLGMLMAGAAFASDALVASRVVTPGEEYLGKSYNELVSEWTQWLTLEPIATNPAFDPDGRFCDRNQEGRVWFLASTFEGIADRTCEIPVGRAIFLSLGGAFVSFAPEFPSAGDPCLGMPSLIDQVRCDASSDVPVAPNVSFSVTLDGEPVEDLLAYRTQSTPDGFTLRVEDNSFLTDLGITPGVRPTAVADGYFLLIKPLRPGVHTLSLRQTNADNTQTGVNYRLVIGHAGGH